MIVCNGKNCSEDLSEQNKINILTLHTVLTHSMLHLDFIELILLPLSNFFPLGSMSFTKKISSKSEPAMFIHLRMENRASIFRHENSSNTCSNPKRGCENLVSKMEEDAANRAHKKRKAGAKAGKKAKGKSKAERNPKAFGFQSVQKAAKTFHRKQDLETKKQHVPLVDRTPVEPPPTVVAIVGPPKVGKTTLISSLIKNFTRQKISDVRGPVTIVSGKHSTHNSTHHQKEMISDPSYCKVHNCVLSL